MDYRYSTGGDGGHESGSSGVVLVPGEWCPGVGVKEIPAYKKISVHVRAYSKCPFTPRIPPAWH